VTKQPASKEVRDALCDFLKACDRIDFANVAHLLAGIASPVTIDAVRTIMLAFEHFDDECGSQYGQNDDLSGTNFYIMHNDDRDPGPDETETED